MLIQLNKAIIKIQSLFRRAFVRNRLRNYYEQSVNQSKGANLNEKFKSNSNFNKNKFLRFRDQSFSLNSNQQTAFETNKNILNRQLFEEFVTVLNKRKITPEEFFRSLDRKREGKLENELFRQSLIDKQIIIKSSKASRLVALLDEDFSGEISFEEYQKSLRQFGFEIEPQEGKNLSIDQYSIIKVLQKLKERDISAAELFNAIDVDSNEQISLSEIQNFISKVVNQTSQEYGENLDVKQVLDKEVAIFLNFMDVDNNGSISKAEFVFQFSKLDRLATRNLELYNQEKSKKETSQKKIVDDKFQIQQTEKIQEVQAIVDRMKNEGLYFQHFINHLKLQSEDKDGMIKLGNLIKIFSICFPTIEIDCLRKILQWIPNKGSKYDIIDLELFLNRLAPDNLNKNSLFQSFTTFAELVKSKKIQSKEFLAKIFGVNQLVSYEQFSQGLTQVCQMPLESIIEMYHSLILEQCQNDVNLDDLRIVLDSFIYQTDKISLLNIESRIENFSNLNIGKRKQKILAVILEKFGEKNLSPLNILKMAMLNANSDIISREQICTSILKLFPEFDQELLNFVFNDKYTKDQFLEIFRGINQDQSNPDNLKKNQEYINYIKILDDALLQLRMSPAILFQQADVNRNKRIDLIELKEVLVSLKSQLQNYDNLVFDDKILKEIISELDINGDGQLQEQEFFSLIKKARLESNSQSTTQFNPIQDLQKQELQQESRTSKMDILPTKPNLLKIMNNQNILKDSHPEKNFIDTNLTDELAFAFEEIEKITNLKNALYNCEISQKMYVRLRDLSLILKKEGVKIHQLINLYKLIDVEYRAHVNVQYLLQLYNQYTFQKKKPFVCNLEFKIISLIINQFPQSLGNVQEYFSKNSAQDKLGVQDNALTFQIINPEFIRLFSLSPEVNEHILSLVSQKFKFGIEKLQNQHLYMFLQSYYNQFFPEEQQKYSFSLSSKNNVLQSDLRKNNMKDQNEILNNSFKQEVQMTEQDQKSKLLSRIILMASGQPNEPLSMKNLLSRYGYPIDKQEMTLLNFIQIFNQDNRFLSKDEANLLFLYLYDQMGVQQLNISTSKQIDKRIKSIELCDFLQVFEANVIKIEMKNITKKLEDVPDIDLYEVFSKGIVFNQKGLILKANLAKIFIRQYCRIIDLKTQRPLVQDYEIYFLLNQMDSDHNQTIEIDELQYFLKLYSNQKKINAALYIKYFAYSLEASSKKIQTQEVLKPNLTELRRLSPEAAQQFANFIKTIFPHSQKPDLLLDLFDFLAEKVQNRNFDAVFSSLICQIDIYRTSIPQGLKYTVRSNEQITKDLIQELTKQRPNFPLFRIMDELQFNQQQGGVLPNLALKNHLRKLYPYADDKKLDLFVTLVDVNNDKRIEINELFKFLDEIFSKEITYEFILNKLAVIIYSTRETVESFLAIHGINLTKLNQNLNFFQFVTAIGQIFKISKYEAYVLFERVKIIEENQIDFKAFVDCLKGQLQILSAQEQSLKDQSDQLSMKIQKQKDKISKALQQKMQQLLKLKTEELERLKDQDQNKLQEYEQQSARNSVKLGNVDVMKLFLDNYDELNNVAIIQSACLNLKTLFKQSSIIRARVLTKRVCIVEYLYNEISRQDLWTVEDEEKLIEIKQPKIYLKETEKLVLTILAIENVSRTFECNVYRFQKLIKRLNDKSAIDFQMLSKILEQRYKQISELLYDDFISIQTIIERVKAAAKKNDFSNELQFEEKTQMQTFLQIIKQSLSLVFRPKEIVLLSREFKLSNENNSIAFGLLKIFMAACGVQIKLKEVICYIFDTLEQAKIGLQILKEYLLRNPYTDIHKGLIQGSSQITQVEWFIQNSLSDRENESFIISQLHQNTLLLDCLVQMRADQIDKIDQIKSLIVYEDEDLAQGDDINREQADFIIVKIKDDYVICDKSVPHALSNGASDHKAVYTYCEKEPLIPIIEKAVAIYLGGYEKISNITNPYQMFQLLNYFDLELFKVNDKADLFQKSYKALYDDYFQPNIMRHIYFRMPKQKKKVANPLINGLEGGRIYSIIAFVYLKTESNVEHKLVVIYNPFQKEDKRKSGEIWSKGYLQNEKKNKQIIELLQQEYDPSVYMFIRDPSNFVYTYDFRDVFENMDPSEQDLIIYFNPRSIEGYSSQEIILNFDSKIQKNELTVSQLSDNCDNAFGILQIGIQNLKKNDQLKIFFSQSNKTYFVSRDRHDLTFTKQISIPKNQSIKVSFEFSDKQIADQELLIKLYFNKQNPFKLDLSEVNYEIVQDANEPLIKQIKENDEVRNQVKAHIIQEETKERLDEPREEKIMQLSLSKSQRSERIVIQKTEKQDIKTHQLKANNLNKSQNQEKEEEEYEYYDEEDDNEKNTHQIYEDYKQSNEQTNKDLKMNIPQQDYQQKITQEIPNSNENLNQLSQENTKEITKQNQ